MAPRITIALCLLAAVITTILGCTSTAGLSASDAGVILFVIGPYAALGAFARWQRGKAGVSRALLAVTAALATLGLFVFGTDSYRYHTEPQYRPGQRMAVFLVPLLQWAVTLAVGLVLVGMWVGPRREAPPGGP
jgi:hypothetical protein